MRVEVQLGGRGRSLAYDAPERTKVGDVVTVPPPPYDISAVGMGMPYHGLVTRLGSDYTGACRRVLNVLPARDAKKYRKAIGLK